MRRIIEELAKSIVRTSVEPRQPYAKETEDPMFLEISVKFWTILVGKRFDVLGHRFERSGTCEAGMKK